jgi:hypothetical protein
MHLSFEEAPLLIQKPSSPQWYNGPRGNRP